MGNGYRQRTAHHAAVGHLGAQHAVRRQPPDGVVVQVGDQQVAVRVQRQGHRRIQPRPGTEPVHVARLLTACRRAHRAIGLDHPDAVVVGIGHVHAAGGIHGHAHRRIEPRLRGRAIGKARHPVAGERAHHAIGADPADAMVAGVGHVHVARGIHGDAGRGMELRLRTGPVAPALTGAGQRIHAPIGIHPADAVVVARVGDVGNAVRINRQRIRVGEARLRTGTIAQPTHPITGQHIDLRLPRQRRGYRALFNRRRCRRVEKRPCECRSGDRHHPADHDLPTFHCRPCACPA